MVIKPSTVTTGAAKQEYKGVLPFCLAPRVEAWASFDAASVPLHLRCRRFFRERRVVKPTAARHVRCSGNGAGGHRDARFSRSYGEADWYDRSFHRTSCLRIALRIRHTASVLSMATEGELIAAPLLADTARLHNSNQNDFEDDARNCKRLFAR